MVIELFLIGVGLSMDAFAVSVCKGLGMEKINKRHAFLIGLYFGGFQALMPFLGWALGIRFSEIHYFGRSLDRLFPVAVYRWKDGD